MMQIITISSCFIFIVMLIIFINSLKEEGEQLKSVVSGIISMLALFIFIMSINLK